MEWLRARRWHTPKLERLFANDELLAAFDVDRMRPEALLWQTGYLTFAERLESPGVPEYFLALPNKEVRIALNQALLETWLPQECDWPQTLRPLRHAIQAGDFPALRRHLESLFAGIPHDWYRNNPITQYEGYWASVFYSHLAALGLDLVAEDVTSQGRIDLTVKLPERIYLFEFKVVELEPEGKALEQLEARAHADKYRAEGKPIHLVGIEFSREARNLAGFEVETTGYPSSPIQ